MSEPVVYQCQCSACLRDGEHPDKTLHGRMNLLLTRLDEQQRRWYVASESMRLGYGGDRALSRITGMNVETIRRGRREVESSFSGRPSDRVRLPGGGRPPVEKKQWSDNGLEAREFLT
jgi:hypothetical protein